VAIFLRELECALEEEERGGPRLSDRMSWSIFTKYVLSIPCLIHMISEFLSSGFSKCLSS
jgi:hypothetical protein